MARHTDSDEHQDGRSLGGIIIIAAALLLGVAGAMLSGQTSAEPMSAQDDARPQAIVPESAH